MSETKKTKTPLIVAAVALFFIFTGGRVDLDLGSILDFLREDKPSPVEPEKPEWVPSNKVQQQVQDVRFLAENSQATPEQKKLLSDAWVSASHVVRSLKGERVTTLQLYQFLVEFMPAYAEFYPQTVNAMPGLQDAVDEAVLQITETKDVTVLPPESLEQLADLYQGIAWALLASVDES